jgi:hypothetical protein
MLVWPARRRAFIGRFGFDPLGDHPIRTQADLDRIPEIIRAKARQPVLILPQ